MHGSATFKLVGNLGQGRGAKGTRISRIQEASVSTPVGLGEAVKKLEEQYGLSLPRESVLILVNGIEANALEDLDTVVHENDQIILIPMFHGGSKSLNSSHLAGTASFRNR